MISAATWFEHTGVGKHRSGRPSPCHIGGKDQDPQLEHVAQRCEIPVVRQDLCQHILGEQLLPSEQSPWRSATTPAFVLSGFAADLTIVASGRAAAE
ncbi:MAG TPA: hypothetical protein VNK51_00795 [Bradyrhizobium sp.]|nr:hypothetical protein [Bradyrhizobium sp.]